MFFLRLFSLVLFLSTGLHATLSDDEINNLLACYKQKIDKGKSGAEKYQIAFMNYPNELLYKLFIDKKRLLKPKKDEENSEPHLIFDVKEPGYFLAMNNAFLKLSDFIGSQIDLNQIVALHDLAVEGVKGMKKGLSSMPYHYGIDHKKSLDKPFNEYL